MSMPFILWWLPSKLRISDFEKLPTPKYLSDLPQTFEKLPTSRGELDNVQPEPVETLKPDDLFNEYYTPSLANGDPAFVDISTSAGIPRTNVNAPAMNVVPERPKKKGKVDAKEASIHDAFGNFMAQRSTTFLKIADSVGYEDRLSAKKERVFAELEKLDLQLIDMFFAHAIIVSAEENVDTFYGIPENYRQAWVEAILAGQIKLKTT
ncbi:hypothetical protein RHSIM_Rhsim09G0105200 [Rhododendron simsii]|uniref:Uncharacterized protein n=1 Tax=Rhododendron simsii TaxID=118357 RepID=A0A834GF52_RHOSS|nr:hypothetical protein RHSIM_Rhsim09G0105200 [Rhododendron simsii]